MTKDNFVNIIQALAFHILRNNFNQNINFEYTLLINWTGKFINKFHKRLQSSGPSWTLSRYKSVYNWVKAHVLEVENPHLAIDPFIRLNKSGVPLEVSEIIHLLHGRSPWIRVIMTVLRYFESITLDKTFDETSITGEYIGKPIEPIVKDFKSFAIKWLKKHGKVIRSRMTLSNLTPHELSFRFKSGPMGPSILTSHLCALALYVNKEYLEIFTEYSSAISSGIHNIFMNTVKLCITDAVNNDKLLTGRISLASEAAGKTRLFAICNFWAQSLLKPLHDQLMEVLKLFEADGTFNQIEQFNRLCIKSKNRRTFSFDLSKATDRFPIVLQQALLGVIVNENFATAWMKLISFLPFTYNNKSYYWKVGQPLGAFSSWAIFALTHHFVVQYCHFKAYKSTKWFNEYSLLGDDIVIWNVSVADEYQRFMEDIGVEINHSKSFVNLVNSGEFAKRHFFNGLNISGFGYPMIVQANASMTGWVRFLEILESEGFRSVGSVVLIPENKMRTSKSWVSEVTWLWTLRNCFAHNLLLVYGDKILSYSDVLESYILKRIELLYNQLTSSSLDRRQYIKLINKLNVLSRRWGVTVQQDCLDIIFVGDELVAHPFVRYLNLRNNIIFDKIELYNENIKDSLFSQENTLKLSSYSQEEFIPSLTVDTFFTEDINEHKFKIKNSILRKSVNSLMKTID